MTVVSPCFYPGDQCTIADYPKYYRDDVEVLTAGNYPKAFSTLILCAAGLWRTHDNSKCLNTVLSLRVVSISSIMFVTLARRGGFKTQRENSIIKQQRAHVCNHCLEQLQCVCITGLERVSLGRDLQLCLQPRRQTFGECPWQAAGKTERAWKVLDCICDSKGENLHGLGEKTQVLVIGVAQIQHNH